MAQVGDLTLQNGQTLGSLTPIIGQPLNQQTLAYVMLAANAANEVYNVGLPASAYGLGSTPVVEGAPLVAQGDQVFSGGIAQPYPSASGFVWTKTQTDPTNGFKGGVLVNSNTNTAVIAIAGMDSFTNGQDQGSGVVFNGANQFNSYQGVPSDPNVPQSAQVQTIRQYILEQFKSCNFNADTKIVLSTQSMGAAIGAMVLADLVGTTDNPDKPSLHTLISELPNGGVTINPANIVFVSGNGEGVTDSVLMANTNMTNQMLADSGVGRIYLVDGNAAVTGSGDIVSALMNYSLNSGEGVIEINGGAGGSVSGYHSTHLSIFPGLVNLINDPNGVIIRQHVPMDVASAVAITQMVGSLGADGSPISSEEGYLRTALGGSAAMALSLPGQSGKLFGQALSEMTGSPTLGNTVGYLSEIFMKALLIQNPVGFAVTLLKGLGLAKVVGWATDPSPADITPTGLALTAAKDLYGAVPAGATREVSVTGADWIITDSYADRIVVADKSGIRTDFALDGSLVKQTFLNGTVFERYSDNTGVIRIAGKTITVDANQETYTPAYGNLTLRQSIPNSGMDVYTIYHADASTTTVINQYDPVTNKAVSQTINGTINGNDISVTYTIDSNNQQHISHVNNINGQSPVNEAALIAELEKAGVTSGQLAQGKLVRAAEVAISANDAVHPNGTQTLFNTFAGVGNAITSYAPPLIDSLTLIKAIQSGEPLPIVASGLRLANDFTSIRVLNDPKNPNGATHLQPTNATINGAANVAGSILSLMSLDAALQRGDTFGAIAAGAQTISYSATAYASFSLNTANVTSETITKAFGETVGGAVNGINTALPYLNIVNSLAHGDALGTAMGVLALNPATAPIAAAYAVFNLVSSLFGGSDAPPEAWGSAHATWSGFNAVANATGAYGGLETATQTYNGVLSYLDQLVAEQQRVNPGSSIGIVANRLPSLSYRNYTGYGITDIDPLTGAQNAPGTLYDLTGRPYNAPAGSVQASQSLSERMIRVALERGAVAPLWEVRTAALQTQMGDPMAGLTEEERAGRAGLLFQQPSPLTPLPPAGEGNQIFRAVALDLNGDGVQTTGSSKTVAFDVDDSGYLKNTAWISNNDGFLFLDRNLNGQIDGGSEVFSNATVALSERGLNGMRWIDSNYDGSLSALDPVWNELKVWQDANGNGTSDAGEVKTLAQLGITSLNYAMGTFERNGQLSELSSPDLAADTEGAITYTVPEGIIVQTSNGQISLLATRIDDRSAIQANRDGVTGYEDTELIISAADLLANDTLAGFAGQNLSITGVSNFTHGSGFLDANGFVHYTPDANYYGAASFDYTVQAPTGQSAAASVDLTLQNVNDAPVATLDQHLQPVYGYDYGRLKNGVRPIIGTHYEPYYSYNYKDDNNEWTLHDTIIGYGDPNPNEATILVTDIDDPAGSFTFDVSAQAQKGEGTVDASGNIGYITWSGPNTPGEVAKIEDPGGDNETATWPIEADPFTVRVTDPHGASTTVSVNTQHRGDYNPNLGSGGSGGKPISIDLDGNGFNFTNVDDSNVFFDINNDGWKHRMAWVAPGDGLLAFDADGNGLIDNGSEISFAGYQPDAQTDLEGLRAFDTNNDGLFSALDAQWGKFGVWQDLDQDGITDAGEFKSLDELGISAVSLSSNGQFSIINGQTVHGIGTVIRTGGSTLNMADVTLQYSDEVLIANADGSASVAVKPPFAPNGEVITGTAGKDLLLGNNGNTIINALEGDDVVMSDIGNDVIDAGAGNDIVYAGGGNDLAIGGTGDDVVFAGLGNDVVLGGDGHDALFGEGGNDVIFGGAGNDLVSGGDGNNVLSGDAGDDQVYGGTGNDALFGGTGNDELAGMEGYDRLDGGAGNDTYLFGRGYALFGEAANDSMSLAA